MSGHVRVTERAEGEDSASNQQSCNQQSIDPDTVATVSHPKEEPAAIDDHQRLGLKVSQQNFIESLSEILPQESDSEQKTTRRQPINKIMSSDNEEDSDLEPIGLKSATSINNSQTQVLNFKVDQDLFKINWQNAKQGNEKRQSRFAREDEAAEEHRSQRTRKKRYDYNQQFQIHDDNEQPQMANNQQDNESPLFGRGQEPTRPTALAQDKKTSTRQQVIPLNKIKFSGNVSSAVTSFDTPKHSFKLKMKSSTIDDQPNDSSQVKPSSLLMDRVQQICDLNNQTKQDTDDFFQSSSKKVREKTFTMPLMQPSPVRTAPKKIKLSKKRPTEDSQVRQSLQQSIILKQSVCGKIDFHQTMSFRDAFPTAGGGAVGKISAPFKAQTNEYTTFESKVQASRDLNFLDNLMAQQVKQTQQTPVVGGGYKSRLLSPNVHTDKNKFSDSPEQKLYLGNQRDCIQPQTANVLSGKKLQMTGIETIKTEKKQNFTSILPNQIMSIQPEEHQAFEDDFSTLAKKHMNPTIAPKQDFYSIEQNFYKTQTMASHQMQRVSQQSGRNHDFAQVAQNKAFAQDGKRSLTQGNGHVTGISSGAKQVDDQLSDWDDDSGDEFSQKNNKNPLTNVRDRTVSLSNVYRGQILSPKSKAQLGANSRNWFTNQNKYRPSQTTNDIEVEDWD